MLLRARLWIVGACLCITGCGISGLELTNPVPVLTAHAELGVSCGDIDNDGDIDQADLNLFIQVLLGNDTNPQHRARCDCNFDFKVDGRDVQGFVLAIL